MTELLKQTDKFVHVFMTERGSLYFMLASGASLHLKKMKELYIPQPIYQSSVFVDQEYAALIENVGLNGLLNKQIPTHPISLGVRPFEIGVLSDDAIHVVKNPGSITIRPISMEGFAHNPPTTHRGRPISRIIK